jgi:hypothetical protein
MPDGDDGVNTGVRIISVRHDDSLRYRPSAPPDARAYGLTLRYGAA